MAAQMCPMWTMTEQLYQPAGRPYDISPCQHCCSCSGWVNAALSKPIRTADPHSDHAPPLVAATMQVREEAQQLFRPRVPLLPREGGRPGPVRPVQVRRCHRPYMPGIQLGCCASGMGGREVGGVGCRAHSTVMMCFEGVAGVHALVC